jgi:hypothetical protein
VANASHPLNEPSFNENTIKAGLLSDDVGASSLQTIELALRRLATHGYNMPILYPDPFLEVRYQALDLAPPTTGLCAGYDGGLWRSARLADHLFNWLPYAALSQEHQLAFSANNFVEMLKLAAAHIYNTKKTASRGELGELMLHLACILHFKTMPVMCKLILKTSSNDTVKGFDGVHLLPKNSSFELWLGESKFYLDAHDAIRDAVQSIKDHILPAFLDTEKAMIFGHVAPDIPHRDEVLKLFKSQMSGDELLKHAVFPILIAYESTAVASHTALTAPYIESIKAEVEKLRSYFGEKAQNIPLRFELLFIPLGKKKDVVDNFDKLLGAFI